MKQKILYGMLWKLIDKGRHDPRWVKKVAAVSVMGVLFFVVSFGFLLYYALGVTKDLVAGKPDVDLLAMERLLTEKTLVLSKEQQRQLGPILEGLAVPGLAPEQAQALKQQLFSMIDPAQAKTIEAWKAAAEAQAKGLFALPPAVSAIIEQYTGLSQEVVMAKINALLTWWQLTKPADSAKQLQETVKSLPI